MSMIVKIFDLLIWNAFGLKVSMLLIIEKKKKTQKSAYVNINTWQKIRKESYQLPVSGNQGARGDPLRWHFILPNT